MSFEFRGSASEHCPPDELLVKVLVGNDRS